MSGFTLASARLRTRALKASVHGLSAPGLLLALLSTACDPRAFNPQNAAIEITVDGVPEDGIVTVEAYVRDLESSPGNRQEKVVKVGATVLFDHLGADFRIEYGLADLARYRCVYLDGRLSGLLHADVVDSLRTEDGQTADITYRVRCRSADLQLTLTGLPAGDSAEILLAHASDTMRAWLRNGTRTIAVVPGTVAIQPDSVNGSDGFLYTATAGSAATQTDGTTTVLVDYAFAAQGQASLEVRIQGAPDDPSLTFRARIRALSGPADVDSGIVAIDASHIFPNRPHMAVYEAVLSGLAAHRCHARENGRWMDVGDSTADTVTVRRGPFTSEAYFELLCHTGALDVTVAGLPAGDSATIDMNGVFSAASRRVPNSMFTEYFVPYRVAITPHAVQGRDGRTYVAPLDTVTTVSRQTLAITVRYAAQQPAAISGSVTGNGFGVVGATVTLTGAANAVTTTGSGGAYSFTNLAPGTYTLTVATELNITFSPASYTVSLASGEQKVVNFAGTY